MRSRHENPHQHALRTGGVERIGERAEVRALRAQPLGQLKQVGERSRQAVEPRDDQRVPCPAAGDRARELRPLAIAARGDVAEYAPAARNRERVDLCVGVLLGS